MARQGIDIGWQEANEKWAAGLADGSETQITTCVTGRVEIDNNEITHKFLVMDTLGHHMLLGMDILNTCAISPPIGLRELTMEQKHKLDKLIDSAERCFETVTGVTSITKHEIRLENQNPIKLRYRLRNPAMQKIINTVVEKMLEEGVIQPSKQPVEASKERTSRYH